MARGSRKIAAPESLRREVIRARGTTGSVLHQASRLEEDGLTDDDRAARLAAFAIHHAEQESPEPAAVSHLLGLLEQHLVGGALRNAETFERVGRPLCKSLFALKGRVPAETATRIDGFFTRKTANDLLDFVRASNPKAKSFRQEGETVSAAIRLEMPADTKAAFLRFRRMSFGGRPLGHVVRNVTSRRAALMGYGARMASGNPAGLRGLALHMGAAEMQIEMLFRPDSSLLRALKDELQGIEEKELVFRVFPRTTKPTTGRTGIEYQKPHRPPTGPFSAEKEETKGGGWRPPYGPRRRQK